MNKSYYIVTFQESYTDGGFIPQAESVNVFADDAAAALAKAVNHFNDVVRKPGIPTRGFITIQLAQAEFVE